jgi:hypothetical protein
VPLVGGGGGLEALAELLPQLALPLAHERGRREDQHAAGQPADGQLLVDDARFDRLAEAHFVGQDGAAAHLAQHPLGDVDLVGQLLDGVGADGEEPVEAWHERESFRFAPQLVPRAVGRRGLQLLGERGERAFVYRPDILDRRRGGGPGWRVRHRHAAGGGGRNIPSRPRPRQGGECPVRSPLGAGRVEPR